MEKTDNHHQKPSKLPKPKESSPIKSYIKYSGLAFQMIATILLGLWFGMKVDEWLQMQFPVFTVVGVLLAITFSLISVVKNLPKS